MNWPFRKYRPVNPPPPEAEGAEARERALNRVADVDHRWNEVHAVAGSLRQVRIENHFAEQIAAIFSGKGHK